MNTLIKKVFPFTIIIGTFMVALGIAYFNGGTVIEIKEVNIGTYSQQFYTFNLSLYLQNLQHSLEGSFIANIKPDLPSLPINTPKPTLLDWVKMIPNILIFVVNILVYITNWLLAPIKIIFYPINLIITLLGINTSDQTYITIIKNIMSLAIPVIPYI